MPSLHDMLKLRVNPRMRAAGVRRRGCVYRIGDPLGAQGTIQIQRAGALHRDEMAFYVNIGVVPDAWREYLEVRTGQGRVPDDPSVGGFVSARLLAPEQFRTDPWTAPLQVRWSILGMDDAEACSQALADALDADVVPTLRRLLDPLELHRFLRAPRSERGVFSRSVDTPTADVATAVLLAPYGRSPELDAAIAALQQREIHDLARWATARSVRATPH